MVAHARNTTTSPAASNKSDLALDAIAALAGRRASPAEPGSAARDSYSHSHSHSHSPAKDKDSAENTIHASGLSPPPPPATQPARQSAEAPAPASAFAPAREQQPSPVASPPPKVRRPLPSAAPADLAASTGLIPGFPTRASSTSYASPGYVITFFVFVSSCLVCFCFLCLHFSVFLSYVTFIFDTCIPFGAAKSLTRFVAPPSWALFRPHYSCLTEWSCLPREHKPHFPLLLFSSFLLFLFPSSPLSSFLFYSFRLSSTQICAKRHLRLPSDRHQTLLYFISVHISSPLSFFTF